jgi:hypothetical protein
VIERFLPNLYKIEIPLPKNPLKTISSYAIIGPEKDFIGSLVMVAFSPTAKREFRN